MRIRFVRRLVSMGVLVGASLLANVAAAAVPGTITHQGRLFDANGAPVSQTLDVTFTIYDAAEGTKVVWTETLSIAFDNGYFSANLGETKPFGDTVFDGSPRYIGITIGGDDEMKPRARVGSVPYALVAGDVRGDINPTSVSIEGVGVVIDENGQWMGDPSGLVGPAGATGPMGQVGPPGPVGPAGAMGPAGATGPMGPQGTPGPAGAQGIPGVAGPAGPQGVAGPAGAPGPAGAQGMTGPMGQVGAMGPAGPMGPAGATGAMGPAGAPGPAGPAGPQGVAGPAGPQGSAGAVGPTGATGPMGPQGAAGPQGPIGPQGLDGPPGPQGAAGPQGPMGPMGPQGPAGATGATGATGAQGTSGFLGSAYANGLGASPVDSANQTYAFIGTTANVVVAGQSQSVFVSATKALGSTTGASGLALSICRRVAGQAVAPTDNGFDYLLGLKVGANQTLPFTLSTRFTGLAAGTYEFGLCGYTTPGQAVNWNSNDWSRVTVILAQ